ncbi:MAG: AAA family ATPase [Bacteroidota bacterium]
MITYISIDGFKTFRNFELTLSPLTVIAGTNASGKSNLFDALRLLGRLAETDLRSAFSDQRGEARELFSMYSDGTVASEMKFEVHMLVSPKVRDNWGGNAQLKYTRLKYTLCLKRTTNESGFEDIMVEKEELVNFKHQEDDWIKSHLPSRFREYWRPPVPKGRRGKPYIYTTENEGGVVTIKLPQDGKQGGKETPANVISQTVLSGVNSVDFPHVFAAKEEMRSWKFLQLSPEALRKPSQYLEPEHIAENGNHLASALNRLQKKDSYTVKEISRRLNRLLPNLTKVEVQDDKVGKQFVLRLKSSDGRWFSSRVLSEGTLRLLVLCVLLYDDEFAGLLCFEEPENGVHPSRLSQMVELLRDLCVDFEDPESELRQVIVNTHSPVLIGEMFNYSNDPLVGVWFSQLITQTRSNPDGSKSKIQATKMLPVNTEAQVSLPFVKKLGIAEAQRFLASVPSQTDVIRDL